MAGRAAIPKVQAFGGPMAKATVQSIADAGVKHARSPLPYADRIGRAFGANHNISGVRTVIGGSAATASQAMGAAGYATRDRIAFASAPSLRTAAHEAAHIIQQRGGLTLPDGVGRPGDAHERHADAVADRVVAGRSAHDLLAPYAGPQAKPGAEPTVQMLWIGLKRARWMRSYGKWEMAAGNNGPATTVTAKNLKLRAGKTVRRTANPARANPSGWQGLRAANLTHMRGPPNYVRMHFLNGRLGGSGSVKGNLAPGSASMNSRHSSQFESKVITALNNGALVHNYIIDATYQTGVSPVGATKALQGKTLKRMDCFADWTTKTGVWKQLGKTIKETAGIMTKPNW